MMLGLGLMLLPDQTTEEPQPPAYTEAREQEDLPQRLEEILSRIEGAGEVKVLLTERVGPEQIYQTDLEQEEEEGGTRSSGQTVILENAERTESAIPVKTLGPEYLGAVVVCQGADNARVRLAVVEAVRCATGLGADAISVQKME